MSTPEEEYELAAAQFKAGNAAQGAQHLRNAARAADKHLPRQKKHIVSYAEKYSGKKQGADVQRDVFNFVL